MSGAVNGQGRNQGQSQPSGGYVVEFGTGRLIPTRYAHGITWGDYPVRKGPRKRGG